MRGDPTARQPLRQHPAQLQARSALADAPPSGLGGTGGLRKPSVARETGGAIPAAGSSFGAMQRPITACSAPHGGGMTKPQQNGHDQQQPEEDRDQGHAAPLVASPVTLPPLVEASAQGTLALTVSRVQWIVPHGAPRATQLRIKWWGEPGEAGGTVAPLRGAGGAAGGGAAFPIACGPKLLVRYLRDAGTVTLAVEARPNGRQIAAATLGLAAARAGGGAPPLSATLPLLGARGQVLGQLDAELRVSYSKALSSFEMNEHLASTDGALPLYPPSAAAAGGVAAIPERPEAAAVDAAVASAATPSAGAPTAAPQPGAAGRDEPAVPKVTILATGPAAAAEQDNSAAAAAAARASSSDGGGDPIAEIILKAERLKAAMDEAISRGLGPSLRLGPLSATAAAPLALPAPQPAPAVAPRPWARLVDVLAALPAATDGGAAAAVAPGAAPLLLGGPAVGGEAAAAAGASDTSDTSGFSELEELEEDFEDLLLERLLLPRGRNKKAAAAVAAAGEKHGDGAPAAATTAVAAGNNGASSSSPAKPSALRLPPPGPPLLVTLLGAHGVATGASSTPPTTLLVRARAAGPSCSTPAAEAELPLTAATSSRLVEFEVPGPAALARGSRLATERPVLALELWGPPKDSSSGAGTGVNTGGDSTGNRTDALGGSGCGGSGGSTGRVLLGIARVPLDADAGSAGGSGSAAAAVVSSAAGPLQLDAPRLLAAGSFPVWDVLAGRENGSLQLAVTALPVGLPLETAAAPDTVPPSPGAPAGWGHGDASHAYHQQPGQQQGQQHQEGGDGQQGEQQSPASPQRQGNASGEQAAGAATAAADSAGPAGGGSGPPLAGVLHRFDVSIHSVTHLPGPEALHRAGAPAPEFRFVGYTFPGDPEALYTGLVPCQPEGTPSQEQHGSSGSSSDGVAMVFAASASHTILLPPGAAVAEHLCGGGGVPEPLVFQVFDKWEDDSDSLVASCAVPLSDLAALAAVDAPGATDCAPSTRAFLLQLTLEPGSGEAAAQPPGRAALLQVRVTYQAEAYYTAAGLAALPALLAPLHAAASPARAATTGASAAASPAAAATSAVVAAAALRSPVVLSGAAAAAASPAPAALPAPQADVCIEVIRACGLQAAVKEAQAWLGGGTSVLGCSGRLGANPYATVELLPAATAASAPPKLRTAFQTQTFCPQFSFRGTVPLDLDALTITALSESEALIEVWHHAPRSAAVAAAMANGMPSGGAAAARSVLLGTARCPLAPLLTRPQGVNGAWLVLKSQRGIAVGAVQVSVYVASLDGVPMDRRPGAPSLLDGHPEWLRLLPAPLAALSRAACPAAPPSPPFDGRLARCSIYIDTVILPSGEAGPGALDGPRGSTYAATYRLPCSRTDHLISPAAPAPLSAAEAARAGAGASHAAGSSLASGWGTAPAAWGVWLGHCGVHWVVADGRLARAVLRYPLLVSVSRLQPIAGGGTVDVPLGSAEVDISSLLLPRASDTKDPLTRWLSGTFALVHPTAKSLGRCSVSVKALLELSPPDAPPEPAALRAAAGAAVAVWDTATPLGSPRSPPRRGGAAGGNACSSAAFSPAAPSPLSVAATPSPSAAAAALTTRTSPAVTPAVGAARPSSVSPHQGEAGSSWAYGRLPSGPTSPAVASPAVEGEASLPYSQQLRRPLLPQLDASCSYSSGTSGLPSPAPAGNPLLPSPRDAAAAATAATTAQQRRRLQAEVFTAAAPGSGAASSGRGPFSPGLSPGGSGAAVTTGLGALLCGGEAGFGGTTAVLRGSPLPAVYGAAETAGGLSGAAEALSVRVCVERSLNLALPAAPPGCVNGLYMRYEWPGATCGPILSPIVLPIAGPLGTLASAQWLQHRILPPPEALGACQPAGGTDGPVLVLQLWRRVLDAAAAAALPPLHAGAPADPLPSDSLVGCAAVDLSGLNAMGCVDGWYHLLDFDRRRRGQVKVEVTLMRHGPQPRVLSPALRPGSAVAVQQGKQYYGSRAAGWPSPEGSVGGSSVAGAAAAAAAGRLVNRVGGAAGGWGSGAPADQAAAGPEPSAPGSSEALMRVLRANLEELDLLSARLIEKLSSSLPPSLQSTPVKDSRAAAGPGQAAGTSGSPSRPAARDLFNTSPPPPPPQQQQQSFAQSPTPPAPASPSTDAEPPSPGLQLSWLRASPARPSPRAASPGQAHREEHPWSPLHQPQPVLAPVHSSPQQQAPQQQQQPLHSSPPQQHQAPQQQQPSPQQPDAAARRRTAAAMQHLRTCSDDEDFAVVGGASESSADTDDLIGRVDWTMADGSDDDMERFGTVVRHTHTSPTAAAAPGTAAAAAAPRGPSQFDPQDWMFDIRVGAGATRAGPPSAAEAPVPAVAGAADAPAPAAAAAQPPPAVNPAAAAVGWATQQQQQQQQERQPEHRPQQREPLPGNLDARLDQLLAEFSAPTNGSSRGAAAAARPRRRRSSGSDDSGDWAAAGVERVSLPALAGNSNGGGSGATTSSSGRAVRFSNTLPPPQDNFPLEYSDRPSAGAWLRGSFGGDAIAGVAWAPSEGCEAGGEDAEAAAFERAMAEEEARRQRGQQQQEDEVVAEQSRQQQQQHQQPARQQQQQQEEEEAGPAAAPGGWRMSTVPTRRPAPISVPLDPNDPFSIQRRPLQQQQQQAQPGGAAAAPRARHPAMG